MGGRHRTLARGKRTADYAIRVIATNLISGTVTVRVQSKAEALAAVQQQINPKLRQEGYEFQLEELVETAEEADVVLPDSKADGVQAKEPALERNGDGAGLGRG